MREILFRGKRIDNGEWVEGFYGIKGLDEYTQHCIMKPTFHSGHDLPISQSDFYFVDYVVDPSTVGQYTGLTANGKKIFEGDVIKTIEYGCVFYDAVVEMSGGCFIGKPQHTSHYETIAPVIEYLNPLVTEVIGNIHDNPELLEVTQ